MEKITLYYRQGSSDKIYQAAIEAQGGGYIVCFAYGRRGTTLTTGTKTQTAVDYAAAKVVYDKLVREKTAKGYTPGEDGTPYQCSDKKASGILPQLLNSIDESEVQRFIANPQFWAQEKHDGRRMILRKAGAVVTGINKLGLETGVPESIANAAQAFEADFVIDGEAVGDHLHAFDILEYRDNDLRDRAYNDRYLTLFNLLASGQQRHIHLVEAAVLPQQKQQMLDRLLENNREGMVFKRSDAVYTAGRPNTGGPQLKFKFVETASFIVIKVNAKRSVSLMVFDGDRVVPVGNVTIPPNHGIPRIGAIVEVRFLYAFRGGSVYQPVYLGVRDDIRAEECQIDQLKYKLEEVAA